MWGVCPVPTSARSRHTGCIGQDIHWPSSHGAGCRLAHCARRQCANMYRHIHSHDRRTSPFPYKKWIVRRAGASPIYRCCYGSIKWPQRSSVLSCFKVFPLHSSIVLLYIDCVSKCHVHQCNFSSGWTAAARTERGKIKRPCTRSRREGPHGGATGHSSSFRVSVKRLNFN